MFVVSSRERIEEMHAAHDSQDWEKLRELAHWLKGAGGTAGFSVFTMPAKRLEQLARDEQHSEAGTVIAELAGLCDRLEAPAAITS